MIRSEIEFKKGSILRKEMLQEMYNYPRVALESFYYNYSDGILYGLLWEDIGDDKHIITPGALKYKGEIFYLKESIEIEKEIMDDLDVNGYYRLCFTLKEAEKTIESKTDYYMDLHALQSNKYKEVKENSFWYAYINYSGNGKIELIEGDDAIKYGVPGLIAANDGFSFQLPNWLVKNRLLLELEEKNSKHPLDYQLLNKIYSGESINIGFINVYLNETGDNKLSRECDPQEALNVLDDAIKKLFFKVEVINEEKPKEVVKKKEFRGGSL